MEEESIKAKLKTVIITVFTIFVLPIVPIYIIGSSISKIENKRNYYVLEIENNEEEIIQLLKEDNISYCESIHKIEYLYIFPHSSTTTIYCQEEDNIILYENYKIIKYIKDNGTIERR